MSAATQSSSAATALARSVATSCTATTSKPVAWMARRWNAQMLAPAPDHRQPDAHVRSIPAVAASARSDATLSRVAGVSMDR